MSTEREQRDVDGYLYVEGFRLTECCHAPTTFTGDGEHVCKVCFRLVPLAYGELPKLSEVDE